MRRKGRAQAISDVGDLHSQTRLHLKLQSSEQDSVFPHITHNVFYDVLCTNAWRCRQISGHVQLCPSFHQVKLELPHPPKQSCECRLTSRDKAPWSAWYVTGMSSLQLQLLAAVFGPLGPAHLQFRCRRSGASGTRTPEA